MSLISSLHQQSDILLSKDGLFILFNYFTDIRVFLVGADKSNQPSLINFGIDMPPADLAQILILRSFLNTNHIAYLIGVATLLVLAIIISLKTLSIGIEDDRELLNISLYIGVIMGLLSGASVNGSHKLRIQIMTIGMIVCSSSSIGCSMFVILCLGKTPPWIISVSILASAFACMWLLTYYDGIVKAISSVKCVNDNQLDYILHVVNQSELLMDYAKNILNKGRKPIIGEYWAIQEWISENSEPSNRL